MPICEQCGAEDAKQRCARCGASWYCSRECQRIAWKAGHKVKCVTKEAAAPSQARGTLVSTADRRSYPADPLDVAAAGAGGEEEECAVCLEGLRYAQTLPCGHRFCRKCVCGLREHGVGAAQLCPLCRGPVPDATQRLHTEACAIQVKIAAWMQRRVASRDEHVDARMLPAGLKGELRRAEQLLADALALDESNPAVHWGLAQGARMRRDMAAALRHFQRVAALQEAQPAGVVGGDGRHHPHLEVARTHYAMGAFGAALAALRKAIGAQDTAPAQALLAEVQMEAGDMVGAFAAARRATRLDGSDPDLWFLLGTVADDGAVRDYPAAERAFRRALELDPRFVDALCNLGVLLKDTQGGSQRSLAEAEALFRKALALRPTCPSGLINLGSLLARGGGPRGQQPDFGGAEALYRRCIAAHPREVMVHYNLGNLLSRQGRHAAAAACYRCVLELDGEHYDALLNLGNVLHKAGGAQNCADAESAARAAIKLRPAESAPYVVLSDICRARGDHDGCAEASRRTVELEPGNDNFWRVFAMSLFECVGPMLGRSMTNEGVDTMLGRLAEAQQAMRRAGLISGTNDRDKQFMRQAAELAGHLSTAKAESAAKQQQ